MESTLHPCLTPQSFYDTMWMAANCPRNGLYKSSQSISYGSCNAFNHILQGCFTGTGAIIWLPQCQWSNPEGYEWNLVPKHNKAQQGINHAHNSWDLLYILVSLPNHSVSGMWMAANCSRNGLWKSSRSISKTLLEPRGILTFLMFTNWEL